MKKFCLLLTVFSVLLTTTMAQTNRYWADFEKSALPATTGRVHDFATTFRLLSLDTEIFRSQLPRQGAPAVRMQLPLPEGGLADVWVKNDPVMAPGLAMQFPEMQTYRLWSADGGHISGRMGWTAEGFHATLRSPEGMVYIDPYLSTDSRYYTVYDVRTNLQAADWASFECGVTGEEVSSDDVYREEAAHDHSQGTARFGGPPVLQRKYRLAMACTGEFSQFHGGTVETALAAIVVIVNRLNEVFEAELAIRVELIASNASIIFLDAANDPYTNTTESMLSQNPGVLNNLIGFNNYDIGHVISTGPSVGQGVASLRGVCGFSKGAATSTRQSPQNDPFTINIVAHEMGHQFGANHTMSSCQNVNPGTAYEPGGGTTIMAYAGICPAGNNLQTNSDPYYHASSIESIIEHTRLGGGNTCAERIAVGNTEPTVEIPLEDGFYIPISTPFELTATADDLEDAAALTYCWEQFDKQEGVETLPGSPTGNVPIFRTFLPIAAPNRVFPRLSRIINNTSDVSEVLPTYSRNMTFRCTVRDNHPGAGGTAWDEVAFLATETAGPFLVTAPNTTGIVWRSGDYRQVSWNVANTDNELVNCRLVNIRLSVDGGLTYPYMLLQETPNNGSAFVTVPQVSSNQARIRVEAADNIFFDISNANFSIQPANQPGFTVSSDVVYQELCIPNSTTFNFETASVLDYAGQLTFSVVEQGLPANLIAGFDNAVVAAGGSTTLNVNLENVRFSGLLPIQIQVTAADLDTTYRTVWLRLYDTDFSDLQQLLPVQGEAGVVLTTAFSWSSSANALSYDFQLATDPLFGASSLVSLEEVTDTTYSPTLLFAPNQLHYWRVRPRNECGEGPWREPFVFHTVNAVCDTLTATDVPVAIPGTGPAPTRESQIFVPFSGTISDINLPRVDIRYVSVNKLEVTLISPAGTQVRIYDKHCGGTNRIFIGFDDQAPNAIGCPPDDGIVFRPTNPLSAFAGENTQGTWTLRVRATQSGGSPGAIQNWSMEFCASAQPQSPVLVTNDTLFVRPSQSNPVTRSLLLVEDADNSPAELQYRLVTPPAKGELYRAGNALAVGDRFSQLSIDAGNIVYAHAGGSAVNDRFSFVVEDGTGGFIPVQSFNIVIDPNAIVSTEDLSVDGLAGFSLFPNPAADWVKMQTAAPLSQDTPVRVVNVHGQILTTTLLRQGQQEWLLDLAAYPAGIYFVQLGSVSQRLVVR
jgi:subtilisin-like proprotein convertase family protein